jgi:Leucine-rich repeat (LRR) protein
LHLWSNYLSSTISGQLGRLKQLQELFLDDNDLTGTIPPELGQLVNATYIALAENELTGVIPPAFGMLSNLQRLDLQFNNLVGQVPQQLSNLPLGKTKACTLECAPCMKSISCSYHFLSKHRKGEIRGKFFLWQYS